eukprot:g19426.t1
MQQRRAFCQEAWPRGLEVPRQACLSQALEARNGAFHGFKTSGQFFGVLDIAGFESFEQNSLEQLFINLSNEHLQQHFNNHIFKMELDDYKAEGVSVDAGLTFNDNSDIVTLIDSKGGILSVLDEEVSMPKARSERFFACFPRSGTLGILTLQKGEPRQFLPDGQQFLRLPERDPLELFIWSAVSQLPERGLMMSNTSPVKFHLQTWSTLVLKTVML